jgi:hypothetical protein
MRPRSSNLPQVGLVLSGEVILQETHEVLEYVDVLAAGAHDGEAFHQHAPVLGGQFLPVPLACFGHEAAPAPRRAISV